MRRVGFALLGASVLVAAAINRPSLFVLRRAAAAAVHAKGAAPLAQDDTGARLMRDASVKAAVAAARDDEALTLEDQIRLCEIPAPPFKETARGKVYADDFRKLGLKNVRIDRQGNVLGERPGLAARPHLVFSAQLDTVFPEGTDVKVKRDGAVLRGPGIGDDCRGLAVVLGVIRALDKASVQTEGTITFIGTVGEEGRSGPPCADRSASTGSSGRGATRPCAA
jgi:acetylornithine deacetylase/succinyl-diaminopimelate desuccinylase-like protein